MKKFETRRGGANTGFNQQKGSAEGTENAPNGDAAEHSGPTNVPGQVDPLTETSSDYPTRFRYAVPETRSGKRTR